MIPTKPIESAPELYYICLSADLYKHKVKIVCHFTDANDKQLYEQVTLETSEIRLLQVLFKSGYYMLNYNAKLKFETLQKMVKNFDEEGLKMLMRMGFKTQLTKLTSDTKRLLD